VNDNLEALRSAMTRGFLLSAHACALPERIRVVNARPTYSACVATQRCVSPLLFPLPAACGLFYSEADMPFQMTDPALRRWLLVLHQVKSMRGTMRMRPAS